MNRRKYGSGPGATTQATTRALARLAGARAVVLVEGISDQIAIETLAGRLGRDLESERVGILPLGGAQAILRHLPSLASKRASVRLAGLCDAAEEAIFRKALAKAHVGSPETREDLERLGFFVCVEDLESELIRAVGPARVEALLDVEGDLGSFRTLQKQSRWRGERFDAQLRRFLGSGARRKIRYAHLLVMAVDLERIPRPLRGVLTHI